MPVYTTGSIKMDTTFVENFTPAAEAVITYDCFPPPAGTIFRYNPKLTHTTELLPAFLQRSDVTRIEAAASRGGGAQLFSDVWTAAQAALNLSNTLNIDVTQIPDDWERVIECKINRISLQVEHEIYDIDVTATAAVTIDGETFPQGDSLASFRACKPFRYRFAQHLSVNPLCCPGVTGDDASNHSDWLPPPRPIEFNLPYHFGSKWYDPDYKWQFFYKWKLKFEEPEEEESDTDSGNE